MVIIEMQDGRKIELEMMKDKAPNTVMNFLHLAQKGYYDGLTFHRVIKDFMIQGGCPQGSGVGGPGYCIRGEFAGNGFSQNDIKHARGVISMARSNNPDSAGSQFFIMHGDGFFLDGQYAAFGKVVNGMEVLDDIATTATDFADKPKTPQVIKKIYLESEAEVEEPAKLNAK